MTAGGVFIMWNDKNEARVVVAPGVSADAAQIPAIRKKLHEIAFGKSLKV